MASWRQSSKYYLKHVWDSDDRHLLPKFSAREVTCEMLHDLCFRYGVARTIPGHIKDLGVGGKYRPFADMLNRYRDARMTGKRSRNRRSGNRKHAGPVQRSQSLFGNF
jgi:hypothetical protein